MNARKHPLTVLLLCGMAVLILSTSLSPAQVVAKMKGKVVDGEGNPIKGAKVYAKDVSTNVATTPALTSKKGSFLYTSLPPGGYVIWAEKEGYMMAKLLVRITGGDGSVSEMDFYYDDKQDFDKNTVRVFPTGGTLSLVKNEFEITLATEENHTAVVNRLYAEARGGGEATEAEEKKPAAPPKKTNFQKAEEMIAAGNEAAATGFLKLALEGNEINDPDMLTEAHYMLGKASLDQGDLDTAETSLLKARELDPEKSGVSFHLARVYYEKGMSEEATAELEKERALSPDSEAVLQNLAGFYAETGETEKAISTYEEIIELNPENFEAYQQLAALYKEAGDRDKEAEVYARMGDKDPTGQSLYNLGNLAFNADDREKAKFYYEKVIEKNPEHAMAHYQLANTLLGLGDIAGAVSHFETFAKLKPKDPKAAEAKSTAAALKEMIKG